MAQTVTEVLTAATDSVTLINAVNGGTYEVGFMTQAEINEMVQRNVDHLEIILAYAQTLMSQETHQISLAIQMQSQLEKRI
jgi:glutathionyl-hydroquinone reductase